MIIIVEGIDRVGKTTLVTKLKEQLRFSVYESPITDGEERTQEIETAKLKAALSFIRICKKDNIILDRFHLSELVYGSIERGYFNNECLEIDKELSKLGNCILIYVKPTNINESIEKHGSSLIQHYEKFNKLFSISRMEKIECDFYSLESAIEKVKDAMNYGINDRNS